jgi:hypothetical protein
LEICLKKNFLKKFWLPTSKTFKKV